jgi:hypothetical protein
MKTLFNFGWKHLQPLVVVLESKSAQLIDLGDCFDQELLICTKHSHLIILKYLMSNITHLELLIRSSSIIHLSYEDVNEVIGYVYGFYPKFAKKNALNAIILAFFNNMWFFHSTTLFWSGIVDWVNHYSIPYSLQNIENKPKTCIPNALLLNLTILVFFVELSLNLHMEIFTIF